MALLTVRLLGVPLALHQEAAAHHAEVERELALMSFDPDTAPARLLVLGADLRSRWGAFTAQPEAEIDAAVARGDERVDCTYLVPVEAATAAAQFRDLLDEVDEYCRSGELLALEGSARVRWYRRWFLGEFVRQADGAAPTAWKASTGGRPAP